MEEIIIVGAGPCGLSAAVELQNIQLSPLLIEKHAIVHSIYLYPTYMQFFSTPELLEIGGMPFSTPNDKPTRLEALTYYRNVALRKQLRIQQYESVTTLERLPAGGFRLETERTHGGVSSYTTKRAVIATGYFDYPNLLGIPGESLPHVTHYYREAHPYTSCRVVIIGGSNSAIDAAMDLQRVGAQVTVVYRKDQISPAIKPWVRPLFESAVAKGSIRLLLGAQVVAIEPRSVIIDRSGQTFSLDNDFVLALTGFRPERTMLADLGVQVTDSIPQYNPETMETNVPGLYIAGVIASGSNANEVFIETGRLHGGKIARHIAGQL